MVNHKAVKLNTEIFIPSGNDWFDILARSLYISKSQQDLHKILLRSERVELHGKILPISVRCRKSRSELNRNLRTHKHHGEISAITARWRKSRHDLAKIKKLTNIMGRSLQISARSRGLGEISAISARWKKSRRDFAKIQKLINILARSLQISTKS